MFKKELVDSVFGIRKDMFILIKDRFEPIYGLKIDAGNAIVKLENDELIITDETINDYEFIKMNDYNKSIRNELVYSCKHCNQSMGYDTLEGIKRHIEGCLFNEDNKKCVMCKHLKITEEAPYPRNAKQYMYEDTYHAFGTFRTPYCMFKEKVIDEKELIEEDHTECFEFSGDEPVIERSEEYQKWVELSMDNEVEDFYKE